MERDGHNPIKATPPADTPCQPSSQIWNLFPCPHVRVTRLGSSVGAAPGWVCRGCYLGLSSLPSPCFLGHWGHHSLPGSCCTGGAQTGAGIQLEPQGSILRDLIVDGLSHSTILECCSKALSLCVSLVQQELSAWAGGSGLPREPPHPWNAAGSPHPVVLLELSISRVGIRDGKGGMGPFQQGTLGASRTSVPPSARWAVCPSWEPPGRCS